MAEEQGKKWTLAQHQEKVKSIISDETLTPHQMTYALAAAGRDLLDTPGMDAQVEADYRDMKAKGWICDLNEGDVTYMPRYILPDYAKLMEKGSDFLRLSPPETLLDAIMALLAMYSSVPSVTHFPVYIGRLDRLLEPFVKKEMEKTGGEETSFQMIKMFLRTIDRTVFDSFCHGNIGPEDSKTIRLILRAERELQDSTPNLTLLYDPKVTPDELGALAIETALDCAKPSFAKDSLFREELGDHYGIASCYNGLPVSGGAYTLTRLILARVAEGAKDKEDFMTRALPWAIDTMLAFMDAKIGFLVKETPFFQTNFLVKEGFIQPDRFNGLFGVVGMNECVNTLMEKEGKDGKFGYDVGADNLALEIMDFIKDRVDHHENPHCPFWKGRFMLHAQVGTDADSGISPGTRIAIGSELPLYDHIRHAALFHKYFPSGTGDIFPFDSTAAKNPEAVLDIFKGAFDSGMRYISTYSSDSDVIRITGYLVKRSDMDALEKGEAVLNDTVVLGLTSRQKSKIEERKVRKVEEE